jgi:hypothetical protein
LSPLATTAHNLWYLWRPLAPENTGFSLAKTRGHDFDGISVMSTISVSLRNV